MNVGKLKEEITDLINHFEKSNDCFINNLRVYQTIIEDDQSKKDKLSTTFEIEIE